MYRDVILNPKPEPMVRVLHKKVGEDPVVITIPDDFREMQKLVGGDFETVPHTPSGCTMYVNEEGTYDDHELEIKPHLIIPSQATPVMGDVFFTSAEVGPNGGTIGLSDEQIEQCRDFCRRSQLHELTITSEMDSQAVEKAISDFVDRSWGR